MPKVRIAFQGRGPSTAALVSAIREADVPSGLAPLLVKARPDMGALLRIESNPRNGAEWVHWPCSSYWGDLYVTADQAAEIEAWLDTLAPGWRDLRATYGGGPAITIGVPNPFRPFPDALFEGAAQSQLDAPGDGPLTDRSPY